MSSSRPSPPASEVSYPHRLLGGRSVDLDDICRPRDADGLKCAARTRDDRRDRRQPPLASTEDDEVTDGRRRRSATRTEAILGLDDAVLQKFPTSSEVSQG